MAQITIDIPNDKVNRILDAFAAEFGWTADSGVTKAVFTKHQVISYVKQVTKNFEANTAAGTARKAIDDEITAINIS